VDRPGRFRRLARASLSTGSGFWTLLGLTCIGFGAAMGAVLCSMSRPGRLVGVLPVISLVLPTYFFWVLSLPALIGGVAIVISPTLVFGDAPADHVLGAT
jgi:hypothetical protein